MVPIVVMGVAGCGKSTIGQALAVRLGVPYAEADDFHPPANVAKMHGGVPLTDEDRAPWLEAIARKIAEAGDGGLVVSCSALKRVYRDVLRGGNQQAFFVHLVLTPEVATARVSGRSGHFMPGTLVASQFAILEPLAPEESGVGIDATLPVDRIVEKVLARLVRTE
ncbi:gluconokinase [Actinoplanes sp. HUAS TT8]|uniref:gluconokinase n=1 Tax=Actinoplanes sp. HUAS TT8 TaxID=3447453 RepID=UPI003F51D963